LDAGNLFKAENIMHSLESEYGTDQATWPTAIGTGPYRLFPVRIVLAEAYEAAQRWKDAHKEYSDMLSIFCKKKPHESWLNDEITGQMHSISCGISRCFFHLRQYEKALYSGQQALSLGRTNPGTHKLVAEAQAALARKLGGAQQGEASFAHPNATTAVTIMDAIRTMHRGVIYEAPWDDVNKEANTLYLKELMTEAGLAAMIANFENK
jgi:tetratricopeptide (TPR) repeat protein